MYAFIFKINVGMYYLMHEGRISDKEIVCRARPKITSKHKILVMAESHLFICHIWPKHFKFLLFMPSLGVRSLCSNAFYKSLYLGKK